MSLERDIALISKQEERLQFSAFDEGDAWRLGSQMKIKASERGLPLVVDIRIGMRPLFYVALPGTTPENPDWVRRKVNTVYRFSASSYRVGRTYASKGQTFDAARGLNLLEYAPNGGGFPIFIIGTGVVGAVTVSGIPERDDHGFVVECLAEHLGVPHGEIQLPTESD